jgi:hypothetical protein
MLEAGGDGCKGAMQVTRWYREQRACQGEGGWGWIKSKRCADGQRWLEVMWKMIVEAESSCLDDGTETTRES